MQKAQQQWKTLGSITIFKRASNYVITISCHIRNSFTITNIFYVRLQDGYVDKSMSKVEMRTYAKKITRCTLE